MDTTSSVCCEATFDNLSAEIVQKIHFYLPPRDNINLCIAIRYARNYLFNELLFFRRKFIRFKLDLLMFVDRAMYHQQNTSLDVTHLFDYQRVINEEIVGLQIQIQNNNAYISYYETTYQDNHEETIQRRVPVDSIINLKNALYEMILKDIKYTKMFLFPHRKFRSTILKME